MSSTERRNVVARIRREGREARHNNVSRQANPYLHSNAMPWLVGWDQADQDLSLEAEEDARASVEQLQRASLQHAFFAGFNAGHDAATSLIASGVAVDPADAWLAYELPDELKGEWK